MSNNYYTASGNPATGSEGLSSLMRAEFVSLQASFDLLPALTGNGGKAVVVNVGGTALTVTTGTLALAGNLTTTGAFNTTFVQGASVTLTLPVVTGTLATLAGTETLTNKTLVAPALGTPASGVATNLTGTASGLTAGTATNQSGGSVSATTLAASGAVSGAGFTALFASPPAIGGTAAAAGAFTTLSATSTVSGAGFTAWAASPPAIGSGTPGSGAFTTLSASSTVSGTGFSTYLASPPAIGGSAAAAGSFTTLSASSTVSGAGFTAWAASPPAIGGTAAAAGAFTTLSATSTVSGAGMTARFASPGPIGSTAASTGAFTTLSTTGVSTGLTAAAGTSTTQFATTAFATAADLLLTPLSGHLFGMTLSNDSGTPNSVLDISAGLCADSTNGVNITLGAFTKSTAGTWASGTGGNGMGTGLTIANSTFYHVFAIINAGVADVYFDTSVTAANKPASTTAFRRIGSFKTDGTAHIIAFTQNGDEFLWAVPVLDYNNSGLGTTPATPTLVSVPPGVKVNALIRGLFDNAAAGTLFLVNSLDETSINGGSLVANVTDVVAVGGVANAWGLVNVRTSTTQTVRVVASAASSTINITTVGWIDTRGRLA